MTKKRRPTENSALLLCHIALERLGADAACVRFVDHTGKRLVPGVAMGEPSEAAEFAVRELDHSIAGRCVGTRKAQLVADVRTDEAFAALILDIDARAQRDPAWATYRESLEAIRSELSVPLVAAGEVVGALTAYSCSVNAFGEREMSELDPFVTAFGAAVLEDRLEVANRLQETEREMLFAFELKQVARRIAEGLREVVPGSIPNLFRYDEHREGSGDGPFTFLASAGATRAESALGRFPPRSGAAGGRGMAAIEQWRSGVRDPLVVVENVEMDDRGSPSARERGVKSTGCIPLVFRGTVCGVLYLHFRRRHYFTREEKRALSMLAVPAAVAISNAQLVAPPYVELYGTGMLDLLLGPPTNEMGGCWNLARKLQAWARRTRDARGEEIADITTDTIADLCDQHYFSLSPELRSYVQVFRAREGALHCLDEYRDHFVHPFHVFLLGYYILASWKSAAQDPLGMLGNAGDLSTLRQWFVCSVYHDVAYPAEKLESLASEFSKAGAGLAIRSTFDWSPLLLANDNLRHIDRLAALFASKVGGRGQADLFRNWFHERLLLDHDHGALSALMLLKHALDERKRVEKWLYEACLAIALHSWRRSDRNDQRFFHLPPLDAKRLPLAFLLAFCDAGQEWGRRVLLERFRGRVERYAVSGVDGRLAGVEAAARGATVTIEYIDQKTKKPARDRDLRDVFCEVGDAFKATWTIGGKQRAFQIQGRAEYGLGSFGPGTSSR